MTKLPRFVRYFAVQLLGYAVDLALFLLLCHLIFAPALLANLVSKWISAVITFFGQRSFTFDAQQSSGIISQAIKYFALLFINTILSSSILAAFLYFGAPATPAKIVADGICLVINYALLKHVVYSRLAVPSP